MRDRPSAKKSSSSSSSTALPDAMHRPPCVASSEVLRRETCRAECRASRARYERSPGIAARLTIEEVRGNIDLEARFNDIDINRDGVITQEELARYIALQYGVASAR